MLKLEILNHWIVPQQGKFPSEIDEEPGRNEDLVAGGFLSTPCRSADINPIGDLVSSSLVASYSAKVSSITGQKP